MMRAIRTFFLVMAIITAVALQASAHEDQPHGPIPTRPPNLVCDYQGCDYTPSEQIDGFRFTNSRTPGQHGSVGWWERHSSLPFDTVFYIAQCVGTIPFKDTDCGPQIEAYIGFPSVSESIQHFFPEQIRRASSIAWCESRHDPSARSPGGGNHGLFQINGVHRARFEQVTGQPWSAVYIAYHNAHYARWLYNDQGWDPWSCA